MASYKHPELFTPERVALQEQALEFNGFYNKGFNEGYQESNAEADIDDYGLYKSGAFRRVAAEKVAAAIEGGAPLGIIIGDVDSLKYINDSLGHHVGDEVIDTAKSILADLTASSETPLIAGRIGGDEFAILCKGDEEQTKKTAQEFEKRYSKYVNKPGNGAFRENGLDLSVGFAMLSEEIKSFSELMRQADEKMYDVKFSKLGKLTIQQEVGLFSAQRALEESDIRLRDAPKLWRQKGVL